MIPVPPCKKCLLREMAEGTDARREVEKALRRLPEKDLAPENVREKRLAACKGCESLSSGTCLLCGCYVELRAALRRGACPHVPDRWARDAKGITKEDEPYVYAEKTGAQRPLLVRQREEV